jgi:uncharacterized Zn finger protein
VTRFATWWGQAFAEALTVAAPVPVARGKAKTRAAKIRGLDAKTGEASIEVSASSVLPYEVRIAIQAIPDEVWAKATTSLEGKAFFAAKLLAAELPNEVEDAFKAAGGSLFPGEGQARIRCNCPAGPGGCRHGATAQRALAEAVDRDPFLLFDLRGRPRAQVLEALGLTARDQKPRDPDAIPAMLAAEIPTDPAVYRRPRGDLAAVRFHVAEPESALLLLTRLGDPPGWKGTPLIEALGPFVAQAATKARETALADLDEPAPGSNGSSSGSSLT